MRRFFGRVLSCVVAVMLFAPALFAASGEYRALVLSHNPAAYYPLDETSGTTANDLSGNGKHGTYNSVLLGNGGALGSSTTSPAFDGASSYVQLPGAWGGVGSLTIEAWIFIDNSTGSPQSIVASLGNQFVHFQAGSSGNIEFYTDGGQLQTLPIISETPFNTWRHVVVVLASGNSKLYIDGSEVGSSAATFTTIDSTASPRIGSGPSPGRFLNGRIDEVAIYNAALSPAQVAAHFNAQPDGPIDSIASGNWSSPSTWENGLVPTSIDDVQINGSHTVTVDTASVTVDDLIVLGTLDVSTDGLTVTNDLTIAGTVDGSGTLTLTGTTGSRLIGLGTINAPVLFDTGSREIPAGESPDLTNTVTVTGGVVNNGEATLTDDSGLGGGGTWTQGSTGTLHVEGQITVNSFSASAPGNVVDYTGANVAVRGTTYFHLWGSGNGESRFLGGAVTVGGDLSIQGTFEDHGYQITGPGLSSGRTLFLAANAVLQIGTVTGAQPTNGTTLPDFQNYNVSASSTIRYDARANQNIAAIPYANLAVTAQGLPTVNLTKTALGTLSVEGTLEVDQSNSVLVLDIGGFNANVGGDLVGAGDITKTGGSVILEGDNVAFTGSVAPQYDITFAGANAQSIRGTTYNSLTINKTAGTATLAGATTATLLNLTAGTLSDGNFTLSSGGTITIDAGATLRIAATMPAGTHITDPASNVYYEGDGNQLIAVTPLYGNLFLTTGSTPAIKSLDGPGTLFAQNITITNGPGAVTLDASSHTVDVANALSGDGALDLTNGFLEIGGDFLLSGAFTSTGSAVTYDGNGAQVVRGTAYEDLLFNKSGGIATLAGNASVADLLDINSGTFDLATFTLDTQGFVEIDGTLDLADAIFKVAGDININGSLLPGTTSALWLTGSNTHQWTGTASAVTLNSLVLTGTGNMNLQSVAGYDLTINSFLSLDAGYLLLNTPRKMTVASTGTISRSSGAVRGTLAIQIPAGQTRRYEMATYASDTYSPIEITSNAAATINVFVTDASATQRVDRAWTLSGDPATVDLKFEWSYSGYTGDTRGFVPARFFSSNWTFPAGYVDVTGDPNFFARIDGVSAYEGDWTAGWATTFGGTSPSIGSFDPVLGSNGTAVTIYGSNFTGATAVSFNGANDLGFSVSTDNEIAATVPGGATTGTISVTSGAGTGQSFANFTVAAAQTIQTAVSGAWSSTSTWQGGVVPNPWDNIVVNHNITMDVAASVNDAQVNADIAGPSDLAVDGTMTWNSGTISANLEINSGAILNVTTGAGHEYAAGTLNNNGTINLGATLTLSNGGILNNNATLNINGDYDLVSAMAGATPTIDNSTVGQIVKTAGAGVSALGGGADLNSIGTIRAESGTLDVTSSLTTTGLVLGESRIGRGATTHTGNTFYFQVANGATLTFSAGANFGDASDFSGSGTVLIASAVTFNGTVTSTAADFIIDANATTTWTTANLTGTLTWKQGLFTGTLTINPGGVIAAAASAGNRRTANFALQVDGILRLATAGITLSDTTGITNDGTIDFQGDHSLSFDGVGAAPVIANSNIVDKTGGTVSSIIGTGIIFGSTAMLRSQSGTLRIEAPATITGTVEATSAGNKVEFPGTAAFSDDTTFAGSGMVLVNSTATFAGDLFQTAAAARIDTTGTVTFSAATIHGNMEWKDATVAGDMLTIAAGSAIDVITGGGNVTLSGLALTNNGNLELSGASLALQNGASVDNQLIIDIQGDYDLRWNGVGGTGSISNSGTLKKTAGNGTSVLGNGAAVTGSGAIHADTGTLTVSSAITAAGSFNAGTGATIAFPSGGTFNSGASFSGLGTIDISGNATFSGTISTSAGSTMLRGTGSTMTFNAATFSGPVTWKEATFNGTGLTIPAGSLLNVVSGGGTPKLDGGSLTIAGTMTVTTNVGFRNGATFTVDSGATCDIQGDHTFGYDGVGALPTIGLSGSFGKTAGTGTASVSCGGVCTNTATGSIGAAAGILAFVSGLTNDGTLVFDINGPTPLVDFGRISVGGGTLTLGGSATAFVDPAYDPEGGAAFEVMNFTSLSGDFTTKNYTFDGTRTLIDTYGVNDLTLTASGPTIGTLVPATGSTAGGTSVTINGTGFTGTNPGENFTGTVTFDGIAAPTVLWQSATELTATTPAHAGGTVDVAVTNANTETHTKLGAFTYTAGTPPTIASLSVTTGTTSGGTYVEITGTDLATVTQVDFGPSAATILSTSATLLKVRTPAGIGTVSVTVTNPDGNATLPGAFTYTAPVCFSPSATLAWFRGEGDAADSAGGTNGTSDGGYLAGKVGQGFALNGSQHVTVPDSLWATATDLSIDGWVKFNTVPVGQYAMLFGKTAGTGTFESYGVSYKDGLLYFGVGGPGGIVYKTAAFTPSAGVWYHVAMTFDDAGDDLRLYVDGQLALAASEAASIVTDSHPFTIGAEYENESLAYFLDGVIDEVTIYAAPLSAADVLAIYDADTAGKCFPANPLALSIAPATGPAAGGTGVTILGSSMSGAGVTIGANSLSIGSNTQSQITGTTMATAAGTYSVNVTTGQGTSQIVNGFVFANPTTYTSTQNGPWNDPATWGGSGFPDSADSAVVNHDVTVDSNRSVTNLTVNGTGTRLSGSSPLTVTNTFTWNGGDLFAPLTLAATSTSTITGSASRTVGATTVNDGTVTYDATGTTTLHSFVFTNNGTFNLQSDAIFSSFGAGGFLNSATGQFNKTAGSGTTTWANPAFTNNGTMTLSAGSMTFNGAFDNTSAVNLDTGTLTLGGSGTNSGTFATQPATIVYYPTGAHTFSGALSGDGKLEIAGATVTITGTPGVSNLEILSGSTTGAGTLTVSTALAFAGGTLGSTMTWGPACTTVITGAGARTLMGATTNDGTVNYDAAGSVTLHTFNFTNNGVFNVTGDVSWLRFGAPVFTNGGTGTFTKTGGAGSSSWAGTFANNGTMTVAAGTLTFTEAFSNGNQVNVNSATLSLGGSGNSPGNFSTSGTGLVDYSGGSHSLSGNVTGPGKLRVSSATVTLTGTPSISHLDLTGGAIDGTGAATVTNTLNWTGGDMNNSAGSITLGPGSATTISGANIRTMGRVMNNQGVLTYTATGGFTVHTAGINNSGTIDLQVDGAWASFNAPTIANTGTVTKSAGAGTFSISPAFTNSNALSVASGTLQFDNGFTQTVAGTLDLFITNDLVFTRLTAAGSSVTLDGTLDINLGYTPADNDAFPILAFASRTGDFTTKNGLTYTGGSLAYALNANDITLTATSAATALAVIKTAPANVAVNQTFTYTITVDNTGSNPATGVSVSDVMQAGMVPSNISAPSFTCSGTGTLTCTAASLAVGTHTITFDVTAPATPQAISNVVNLTSSNDSTPGDNSSTAVTNVGAASADLAVTVAPSSGTVAVGSSMTWTVTVTNNGPSTASNVVITDTIPAGQTITNAGACGVAGSVVTCNVGSITSGNSANVVITVTADEGGTRDNQATAAATESDPSNLNDVGNASVIVTGDTTLVVTSNAASGTGTLTQAIFDANDGHCPAPCTVAFNIPGSATISAAQPILTATQLIIDGTTQPGYAAGAPVVALDGSVQNPGTHGLVIQSSGGVVKGLSVSGYTDGIRVLGAGSRVVDNLIFNNTTGVSVVGAITAVRILGNSIHSNAGLPIDHDGDGAVETLDAGDIDTGSNNHQNAPVISLVEITPSDLDVTFSVDSSGVPSTQGLFVEVFKTDGAGEPQTRLGGQCFAGNNLVNQLINVPIGTVVAGNSIVATATSYTDNLCTLAGDGTSEVSAAAIVGNCVPPPVSITGPSTVCAGGSVTLDAGPGFASYLWMPGNLSGQSIVVSPAGTTTYTVTVTDGSGCANTANHVVTVTTAPPVSITGPTSSCSGANVTLTATAGFTSYLWQPGNLSGASITVTPASTTTYTLTATDGTGCTSTTSHTVTVTSTPAVAITGPANSCAGGNVTLTATAGFTSYLWQPGNLTGQTITVSPAANTTYTLTATAAGGCTATASHTVAVTTPTPATATASGPTTFCAGGAVVLTASAGASYQWLPNGETAQSITVTSSGTYSVIVTDANGCGSTSNSIPVTVNPLPAVTITGPTATCNATPVTLDAGPGASYLWTPGNFTTQTITVSPASTTTYSVTVTNASGCSASDTHTVTVATNPTATITAPAAVCAGATGTAFTGITSGATYTWTITGGVINSGNGTSSIDFQPTGLAPVQLGVTVAAGSCTATGSTTVNVGPAPATPVIAAPVSVPASTTGHTAGVTPEPGATYAWSIANGTIDGPANGPSINFSSTNVSPITLSVTVSLNGCLASATKTITVDNATPDPDEADLSVTKSAPASVITGSTFTYTITVSNNGPKPALNAALTDTLPAGLTLLGFDDGVWSCGTFGGQLNCTIPSLDPGSFSVLTVNVQAPSQAATIVNSVSVSSAITDPSPANNTASASTNVVVPPATCPAAAPSLTAPANGATVTSPVTLSWSAVSGTTTYDVWTSLDGVLALAGSTSSTSLTVNAGSGTTSWYVVAHGNSGCTSLTSATRTFTVTPTANCGSHGRPQITSPAQPVVSSPVTLSWTPVPQAVGYRVWISVDGTALQDVGSTDGAITLSVNVPAGAITVFVDALFNACPPTRSDGVSFEVPQPDPCARRGAAGLTAPANNATVNASSVELRWSAAPTVGSTAPQYRVWASVDGEAPEVRGTTAETSLRAVFDRGRVVWFVETLYPGCPSTESPRFTFTIPARNECGNARPNLIAPVNTTVTSGSVAFTWSGVADAIGYEIYLSQGPESAALIGTVPAGTTTFNYIVPPGRLTWFVRAVVDRCPFRDSAPSSFTYAPPAACEDNRRPILIAPLEGPSLASPVTFTWDGNGAARYELYLHRATEPPALVASTTAPEAPGVALAAGTYRWFVRGFFNGCSPLDSPAQELTVVDPPSACAVLSAPVVSAPGQISSGVEFLLQWSPAPGATSYQLQVSSSESFAGAETITTTGTTHALVRTNNGAAPLGVYARVRAIDSRCTPPTVTAYGPVSAVFILPAQGDDDIEAGTPLTNDGPFGYTIPLGPELAGQTFTAVPNQPWLNVTPSSGVVGAAGTNLLVTAQVTDLSVGTNSAAVVITLDTPSARVRTTGTTTSTTSFTINLVSPVTPAPKNTPPPDALIIPAVANADGINSHFQSDVRVSNTSPQVIKYQLTFTPTGETGLAGGRQTTFSIEPGRTVALDDVLKAWFGTGSASSTGTLEVRPLTQTATSTSSAAIGALANLVTFASSRTFNVTPNGTFGQHIPAIPYANFIGKSLDALKPTVLSLQQIAQSSKYRTNLGLVEGSGEGASLLVKVFGSDGAKLGEFPVTLKGGQHTQMNGVLAQNGITNLSDGRIEVEVVSGNGKVTAYASVLDNQTSDPLLVSPITLTDSGSTKWVVPGVADLHNGVANWQTDLRIFNAGTAEVSATLSFYSQNGGEPRTATLTIPAGQVRTLDRTLASVFGASNDGGAVHIATASDARLIATARTYNQTTGGTYGQFISAVTPAEAAGVGTRPLQLLQVEESTRFRSNIGLAEVTGNPVRLEVSVIPPDAKFTAVAQVDLGPNEFRQIGSLLRTLGLGDTYNARVTVRAIEGNGRVAAYASVIDMQTNDPTYVPAQ